MQKILPILNINDLRATSAKSINLHPSIKLTEYSSKKLFLQRQCLLLPFLGYCSLKVGLYYQPPREVQGARINKYIFRKWWCGATTSHQLCPQIASGEQLLDIGVSCGYTKKQSWANQLFKRRVTVGHALVKWVQACVEFQFL